MLVCAALAVLLANADALAQRRPPAPENDPAAKIERKAEPAPPADGKVAVLNGLDKVNARITHIEVKVGERVRFGSLDIIVRRCQRSGAEAGAERAVFAEIYDTDLTTKRQRLVFSGWMFAAHPAVAALDHPVYDVWIKDCR
jgi:hypothetical protein